MNLTERSQRTVDRVLGRALTVRDLITALKDLGPDHLDNPVIFTSDYGDHCHTQQVHTLNDGATEACRGDLSESGYSHSGIAYKEDDDEDEMEVPTDPAERTEYDRVREWAEQPVVILA